MWTSRNLVALGLFLFGTAYLWLAAGRAPAPSGTACTLTNVLAYVAVIGSAAAACGGFKQYSWWETAAVVSGVAGLVAVVSFVAGQGQFDAGVRGLRRADPPVDAHPGQRGRTWDRARTGRSRWGHTVPMTRPARSPGLRRHPAGSHHRGQHFVIDPAGRER
jgi:hypothetical protein